MGKYGNTAIAATKLIQKDRLVSPIIAWKIAAAKEFEGKSAMTKGCPKCAYLSLCGLGLVKGVSEGNYCDSLKNKNYVIKALEIIKIQPNVKHTEKSLWQKIIGNEFKVYNNQMDVLLSLWYAGLIIAK